MPRRLANRCLLLAVLVAAGCTAPAADTAAGTAGELLGRDLILVTVDTLRADAVGAYAEVPADDSPTPVADELARRGVVFTQATTPFPRTTPALASLLSGRSPKHHGSREVGQPVAEYVPFLSQVLADEGYLGVAVTGNRAAAGHQGFDRGFDAFELVPGDKPTADEITDAALGALEEVPSDRPLFLWVHYVDPHMPYGPLGPASDDSCAEAMAVYEDQPSRVFADREGLGRRSLGDCRQRYLGEVRRSDTQIGRLFGALREMGRPPEESLVVFTSDHGENQGEDGLFYEHGPSLHDASLRVPLIVAAPGLKSRVDDRPIRLEDLPPTLLTLLGVEPENRPPMEGQDLANRLWSGSQGEEPVVSVAESGSALHPSYYEALVSGRAGETYCAHDGRWSLCATVGKGEEATTWGLYDHEADPLLETDVAAGNPDKARDLRRQLSTWPPETARLRSARDDRFKLVEIPQREGGRRRALYDLENDPAESRDVSAEHPEVMERLGRVLDAYVADLPVPGETLRDDEELEALRALGYVE